MIAFVPFCTFCGEVSVSIPFSCMLAKILGNSILLIVALSYRPISLCPKEDCIACANSFPFKSVVVVVCK